MMETTIAPSIDTARNAISGSETTGARAAADLNFDTFLQLLTTQLRNQDPLSPLDGTAFTEQIATFSALEQQIATNDNLEKLLLNDSFSQQSAAIGLIGQEVLAPGNVGGLKDGILEFSYTQEEESVDTVIEIFDREGVRVAVLSGATEEGQHNGIWNGTNADGEAQPEGDYLLVVTAVNEEGDRIDTQTLTFQRVVGIQSEGNGVFLNFANGNSSLFSDTFTVRQSGDGLVNNEEPQSEEPQEGNA